LIIGKVKVFSYNITMKDIDKFFSDADRILARWRSEGSAQTTRLASMLSAHFRSWTRSTPELAEPLADYWERTYTASLADESGRKAAVEWLGSLHGLLTGEFDESMDFPAADWEEIRDTINAEALSMDMELLTQIMSIIVSRGHS